MTENLTVCPDCGDALQPVAQHEDPPVQVLQQECDCGYDVTIAILNYPKSSYEVLGPALPGDTCTECDNGAMVRRQRTMESCTFRCASCIRLDQENALSKRKELP